MTLERVQNFLGNPRNRGQRSDARELLRKLRSFNGECAYCGHPMEQEGWDQIDHIHPVWDEARGLGTVENLLPACVSCNQEKGHFDADGWFYRLSVQRPNWPGAMLPEAVRVRAAHGMDEEMFLLARAEKIATHGEGREREDERRAREERERQEAEREAELQQLRRQWNQTQDGLIEAEVERRLAARPPKVVEVEKIVEVVVEKPRPYRLRRIFAGSIMAGLLVGGVFATGLAFAPDAKPEVRTVTRTVESPPRVVTKWRTKRVEVPVAVAAKADTIMEAATTRPPLLFPSRAYLEVCKRGYRAGYAKGKAIGVNGSTPTPRGVPDAYLTGYDSGVLAGQLGMFDINSSCY